MGYNRWTLLARNQIAATKETRNSKDEYTEELEQEAQENSDEC